MNYPRRIFHEQKAPWGVIVISEDQEKSLGEGWVETPRDFKSEEIRKMVEFPNPGKDMKVSALVAPLKEASVKVPLKTMEQVAAEANLGDGYSLSSEPLKSFVGSESSTKPLQEMEEKELKEILVGNFGYTRPQLNRKSKESLIQMIRAKA